MSANGCQKHSVAALAVVMVLSGCGGGGGVQSAPPLQVTPTPTPTPTPMAVEILQSPATQEFVSLTSAGSSGDLKVRFNATTGRYDVSAPGADWQALRPSSHYHSEPEHYFAYGPAATESFFQVAATAKDPQPTKYLYSSLAAWGEGAGAYWDAANYTAFGVPTSAAAMPITGMASYQGVIAGSTDIMEFDGLVGAQVAATIDGSVALNFNFGAGTLSGSMHPFLTTFSGRTDLGTLTFANTVYSAGSTTFSGRFNTTVMGANAFDGRFTGPAAEELIGRWRFPFVYSVNGATHNASGAWIAKQ